MSETLPINLIENWYAEPFTKRTACEIPGQCGGDCDCGCPYNTMTEIDRLPLIEEITAMFPNEWLAFIISPKEDEDLFPTHGKLIAHSSDPDEVFDATNTVLWNQCVYTFFNGAYETLEASYGDHLASDSSDSNEVTAPAVTRPQEEHPAPPPGEPAPERLLDLVCSALDKLYGQPPDVGEGIRRLRIAKIRLNFNPEHPFLAALDRALDNLEGTSPSIAETIWALEEALVDLEPNNEYQLT